MKAYGKQRRDCANRTLKGTSRPCPCCEPVSSKSLRRGMKKRARRLSKEDMAD